MKVVTYKEAPFCQCICSYITNGYYAYPFNSFVNAFSFAQYHDVNKVSNYAKFMDM